MIYVSRHNRLDPASCPKLIANVQAAFRDDTHERGFVVYKGYVYIIDSEGTWTCFQGAIRSEAYNNHTDPINISI
jgi:hypothetical protein